MLYAIVHKNRVIVGPLAWARKYFTEVLKIRHRIDSSIPETAPVEFPFVVDENTAIYEAVENQPPIDSMIQCYHGPHWDTTQNPVVANYDVFDHDIETARNNFKTQASFERYKKEVSGTKVTLNDVEVSLSTVRGSKEPYIQKLLSMEDDEVCKWKFENVWMNLTKEDLKFIIKAIDTHVQSTFDWEADIHDQLDTINVLVDLHTVEIVEKPTREFGAE
jgi:hypothetical protein